MATGPYILTEYRGLLARAVWRRRRDSIPCCTVTVITVDAGIRERNDRVSVVVHRSDCENGNNYMEVIRTMCSTTFIAKYMPGVLGSAERK